MSIFSIFTLFGGLAFFIYGMNQMSHSLERIAGNKIEQFIKKMIAIAVIEADSDVYDPHEYISKLRKKDNLQFEKMYNRFRQKYMV